jgi:hypothetical protein
MDSVIKSMSSFNLGMITTGQFIHTEKETCDCRILFPQPETFKRDVTTVTNLIGRGDGSFIIGYNVTMCQRTSQGDISSCKNSPPLGEFETNISRCNETYIEHPSEIESISIPVPFVGDTDLYFGNSVSSETHVYKCFAGNVQHPNKIKTVTLFTTYTGPYVYVPDGGFNNVYARHAAITCVKDISTARVEACMVSNIR